MAWVCQCQYIYSRIQSHCSQVVTPLFYGPEIHPRIAVGRGETSAAGSDGMEERKRVVGDWRPSLLIPRRRIANIRWDRVVVCIFPPLHTSRPGQVRGSDDLRQKRHGIPTWAPEHLSLSVSPFLSFFSPSFGSVERDYLYGARATHKCCVAVAGRGEAAQLGSGMISIYWTVQRSLRLSGEWCNYGPGEVLVRGIYYRKRDTRVRWVEFVIDHLRRNGSRGRWKRGRCKSDGGEKKDGGKSD